MAGRPPSSDVTRPSTTDASRLTCGSTPATTENEITSGTSANAVMTPARPSRRSRRGSRSARALDSPEVEVERIDVGADVVMTSSLKNGV